VRRGYEWETAYRIPLPGWFLVGETVVGEYIQPVVRYSTIDNTFDGPREYPAPTMHWDWNKWDTGVRVGLTPNVDVTAEFSHNFTWGRTRKIYPHEFLTTLRVGF
jgi:hypothetical protein